jgi:cobalt/nickel transport system permease protein
MKNRIHEIYALEKLSAGGTCIHRLHPTVKLLAAAVFIVTVVSFNRYALGRLVPYIFYTALLAALSETPYSVLLKRFLVALPFCLFAGISNVIFDRTAAFAVGGVTVSYGLISLFTILFKTYLCVMAVLILVSVTPFSDLTSTLRCLRIPNIFIIMFEMTYRYIGVLLHEAYNMNIAYLLRSPAKKGIEMRDMGSFSGQLLIRSFDRADRVYNAMKCRGYAGYALQTIPQDSRRLTLNDIVFFGIVSSLCVTFRFVDVNSLFARIAGRFL